MLSKPRSIALLHLALGNIVRPTMFQIRTDQHVAYSTPNVSLFVYCSLVC